MPVTRKMLGSFAAVAVLSLSLAGCAAENNETPAAEEAPTAAAAESAIECSIGMVQINQTAAFFTEMNKGAEEASAATGCDITISNANGDATKQASDIENFVTQGVTGLIVVAIDVNAVAGHGLEFSLFPLHLMVVEMGAQAANSSVRPGVGQEPL
mgnify:CR=1 FL=1